MNLYFLKEGSRLNSNIYDDQILYQRKVIREEYIHSGDTEVPFSKKTDFVRLNDKKISDERNNS